MNNFDMNLILTLAELKSILQIDPTLNDVTFKYSVHFGKWNTFKHIATSQKIQLLKNKRIDKKTLSKNIYISISLYDIYDLALNKCPHIKFEMIYHFIENIFKVKFNTAYTNLFLSNILLKPTNCCVNENGLKNVMVFYKKVTIYRILGLKSDGFIIQENKPISRSRQILHYAGNCERICTFIDTPFYYDISHIFKKELHCYQSRFDTYNKQKKDCYINLNNITNDILFQILIRNIEYTHLIESSVLYDFINKHKISLLNSIWSDINETHNKRFI